LGQLNANFILFYVVNINKDLLFSRYFFKLYLVNITKWFITIIIFDKNKMLLRLAIHIWLNKMYLITIIRFLLSVYVLWVMIGECAINYYVILSLLFITRKRIK